MKKLNKLLKEYKEQSYEQPTVKKNELIQNFYKMMNCKRLQPHIFHQEQETTRDTRLLR